jgi:hypothetical protein
MIRHVAGDAGGLPLSVTLSAANANDSTMLEAVLDDIPPIRMPTGSRRRRPAKVHGDKAYDHRRCRAYLRRRGIQPRMIGSSQRLGRHRWTIERTGAAGRVAAATQTLRTIFRAFLRPGDARLLGHLLQHPPAATLVTVSDCSLAGARSCSLSVIVDSGRSVGGLCMRDGAVALTPSR